MTNFINFYTFIICTNFFEINRLFIGEKINDIFFNYSLPVFGMLHSGVGKA